MSVPNTISILTQIQTYLVGTGLYTTVVIGAQKDWTGVWPIAELMIIDDKSEHWTLGGQIRDTQGFRIVSGVSFTQQTPLAAVTQLCSLRDTIVPLFQQHAYLGGSVLGVQDSRVRPATNRISFIRINGDDYLIHELIVEVCSVYSVPIGASGI
jgi:hypothetical protein